MNAQEYVAKAYADKGFLQEIVSHTPDKVVADIQNSDGDGSGMTAASVMAMVLCPAASSMGVQASQQEIEAECERQQPEKKFAYIKALMRVGRLITKEYNKRKL